MQITTKVTSDFHITTFVADEPIEKFQKSSRIFFRDKFGIPHKVDFVQAVVTLRGGTSDLCEMWSMQLYEVRVNVIEQNAISAFCSHRNFDHHWVSVLKNQSYFHFA